MEVNDFSAENFVESWCSDFNSEYDLNWSYNNASRDDVPDFQDCNKSDYSFVNLSCNADANIADIRSIYTDTSINSNKKSEIYSNPVSNFFNSENLEKLFSESISSEVVYDNLFQDCNKNANNSLDIGNSFSNDDILLEVNSYNNNSNIETASFLDHDSSEKDVPLSDLFQYDNLCTPSNGVNFNTILSSPQCNHHNSNNFNDVLSTPTDIKNIESDCSRNDIQENQSVLNNSNTILFNTYNTDVCSTSSTVSVNGEFAPPCSGQFIKDNQLINELLYTKNNSSNQIEHLEVCSLDFLNNLSKDFNSSNIEHGLDSFLNELLEHKHSMIDENNNDYQTLYNTFNEDRKCDDFENLKKDVFIQSNSKSVIQPRRKPGRCKTKLYSRSHTCPPAKKIRRIAPAVDKNLLLKEEFHMSRTSNSSSLSNDLKFMLPFRYYTVGINGNKEGSKFLSCYSRHVNALSSSDMKQLSLNKCNSSKNIIPLLHRPSSSHLNLSYSNNSKLIAPKNSCYLYINNKRDMKKSPGLLQADESNAFKIFVNSEETSSSTFSQSNEISKLFSFSNNNCNKNLVKKGKESVSYKGYHVLKQKLEVSLRNEIFDSLSDIPHSALSQLQIPSGALRRGYLTHRDIKFLRYEARALHLTTCTLLQCEDCEKFKTEQGILLPTYAKGCPAKAHGYQTLDSMQKRSWNSSSEDLTYVPPVSYLMKLKKKNSSGVPCYKKLTNERNAYSLPSYFEDSSKYSEENKKIDDEIIFLKATKKGPFKFNNNFINKNASHSQSILQKGMLKQNIYKIQSDVDPKCNLSEINSLVAAIRKQINKQKFSVEADQKGCNCETLCRIGCPCYNSMRMCYKNRQCCCRNCENPINVLFVLDIQSSDMCLIQKACRLKLDQIIMHINAIIVLPCCDTTVSAKNFATQSDGIFCQSCKILITYSWCYKTTVIGKRSHCRICKMCCFSDSRHCKLCNDCMKPSLDGACSKCGSHDILPLC